jgi:hypothetical protein
VTKIGSEEFIDHALAINTPTHRCCAMAPRTFSKLPSLVKGQTFAIEVGPLARYRGKGEDVE